MQKRMCSKQMLIEELWADSCYVDENALYVNINRLREKLRSIGAEGAISDGARRGVPAMNILRFLRSKFVPACILLLLAAAWSYLAALAAIPPAFIALSDALLLLGAALVWLWQYLRARRRLQKLRCAADRMGEKAYLLGEVLERPADALEEEYYEIMKGVSRSAVNAAETAIRARDEYGDYMEKWVHELKTPLTAASLILAGGGDAQKLRVQIRRADNLAESVLCYARLREAGSARQISRVRLREAADEAVKGEMELLLAAGVRVEVEGDAEVSTDRGSVVFAVKQLLVNCAKYCKGGRVRIEAERGRAHRRGRRPRRPRARAAPPVRPRLRRQRRARRGRRHGHGAVPHPRNVRGPGHPRRSLLARGRVHPLHLHFPAIAGGRRSIKKRLFLQNCKAGVRLC